jgi:hypothetical protein
MINTTICIPDKYCKMHKWVIEEDRGAIFTIIAEEDKRYISHIRKDKVYIDGSSLYSDEIKNPFCTIENKRYSKSEFFEIWLED